MLLWKTLASVICCALPAVASPANEEDAPPAMSVENEYLKVAIDEHGKNLLFVDRQSGVNYCKQGTPFARIRRGGTSYVATNATFVDDRLALEFGESGVRATLRIANVQHALIVEVISVTPDRIEELTFVDIPLTLTGALEEPFAGCALALDLKTNVRAIPQATAHLWATCYERFGFAGAKVALIGCPYGQLRTILQRVVTAAPDLPHSPIGGPWALDGPNNYGSYLFDFGNLTEETVDSWIALAKDLGVTQIDFHGGRSFRFGDFQPAPDLYPRGVASMKAVIDKLHAAGMQAGLHTYAMFMDKKCPYVTPIPDPRLGKDATFTLASDLTADATQVLVTETTKDMSTTTGFFVRNSVTLQIEDELITYAAVSSEPPYAFAQCTRGAWGTKIASHKKGAPVQHLRECFGRFLPDGDSTLFSEVAAKTADLYNGAGFDMIYLDALDGGDTVAGRSNAWHYQSKFTFELFKRLKRPAIMEMSTFHHHLWYVRSRMGAWDHPNRSHKKFIDIHCQANAGLRRQFLPGNLGWWAFKTWHGPASEPTHVDDIEYLCGKALGNNHGLSLMGINPSTVHTIPALPRLAAIVRQYEQLRRANYFTEAVKERLRAPGDEFTLLRSSEEDWRFRPVRYDKHKVHGLDGGSHSWTVTNPFEGQPLRLRIEALSSVGRYDAPGNICVAEFSEPDEFPDRGARGGVSATLVPSPTQVKVAATSGEFTATNASGPRIPSWCKFGKTFAPPLDLNAHQALGLWVHGDGKGEIINLQQTSPSHLTRAHADHYIEIDFTGWRYFEMVEAEGERHAELRWPYGSHYSIYRESIRPASVETLSVWYNNIPPGETVCCYLSPIRALPVLPNKMHNPRLTVGGKTISFPVEIETGQFLEFRTPDDCRLYGPKGEEIRSVVPEGDVPVLRSDTNDVVFTCDHEPGMSPRAYVTVMTQGAAFGGMNPKEEIHWELLRDENRSQ